MEILVHIVIKHEFIPTGPWRKAIFIVQLWVQKACRRMCFIVACSTVVIPFLHPSFASGKLFIIDSPLVTSSMCIPAEFTKPFNFSSFLRPSSICHCRWVCKKKIGNTGFRRRFFIPFPLMVWSFFRFFRN